MTQTIISSEKIKAFENTNYWVHSRAGPFALRVGVHSVQLEQIYRETNQVCGAFITAYNPYSEQHDDASNRVAQKRLAEYLHARATFVFEGEGKDPEGNWPGEPSLFALGLDEAAARLIGVEFRQDAIIWIDRDATPRLILLR